MLNDELLKQIADHLASRLKGEKGADGKTPTKEELIALILSVLANHKHDFIFKGDKGDKGDKPIAGVDFKIPDEKYIIESVLGKIPKPKDGYTPLKGKDYFDGQVGRLPKHEYIDKKLRFELPNGNWGDWIDFNEMIAEIANRYAAILQSKTSLSKKRIFSPVGTRIASQDEVDAGLEDNKIVTPKTLANYSGLTAGNGDMTKVVYDPTAVEGDAFAMDNMVEGVDTKIMTADERTKLSGIEESADVTDATNVEAAGTLMRSGGTMTGDIQLGETEIKLDAVLSADEKWSGITISGTLGATIGVGDLCYLNADDGRWELVDANLSDGYDKQLGICLVAGNDGSPTTMLVYGKVRSAAFPAFTLGSPLYMSETAGDITHTQPTTADVCIRIVGFALTAEDLLFNPSNDYIIHV